MTQDKPAIGLRPRSIWESQRIQEIEEAMERYGEAGCDIPREWLEERHELQARTAIDTPEEVGLSVRQLSELLYHIEKHNSWKNNLRAEKLIKYVDISFDTRDCRVWKVNLRLSGEGTTFRTEAGYNLKEKIYEHLKGEGA